MQVSRDGQKDQMMTILSDCCFWKLKNKSFSSSHCQTAGFHCVSSLSQYSKEGDENRQNPNDTKLTIVTEIQLFFLNKFSLDCCKILDIFRVLKKLILTLLIFFLLFLRRNKYLEVLTPLFTSKKLFFPEKKSKVHSPIKKALGKRLSLVLWSATIYLRHIFRNINNIRFIKKIKSIKI